MARVPQQRIYKKGKLVTKTAQAFEKLFGNPPAEIVRPLYKQSGDNSGIIFPFIPNINYQYTSNYSEMVPAHSNFTYPFYQGSALTSFTAAFTMPSTTQKESRYTLAAHHFLRSCTKMTMNGGDEDFSTGSLSGTPPPILEFSIFGEQMYQKVPCVIEVYAFTLESEGKSYVSIPAIRELAAEKDWPGHRDPNRGTGANSRDNAIPVDWQMTVTLKPAYNPRLIREGDSENGIPAYSTKDFANGKLLSQGYQ